MSLLSPVLRALEGNRVAFRCPGCGQNHQIYIGEKRSPDDQAWSFDGDAHAPTFSPSVDARGVRLDLTDQEEIEYDAEVARLTEKHGTDKAMRLMVYDPKFGTRCHSFVRAGMIQFLADCTHDSKNLTLPLLPWPNHENQKD